MTRYKHINVYRTVGWSRSEPSSQARNPERTNGQMPIRLLNLSTGTVLPLFTEGVDVRNNAANRVPSIEPDDDNSIGDPVSQTINKGNEFVEAKAGQQLVFSRTSLQRDTVVNDELCCALGCTRAKVLYTY
uniref:MSP domain-containing protein n=1 Tax=Steinernema glaseri TaxID=37863 RepID=A0A1I7Y9H4_9BILA